MAENREAVPAQGLGRGEHVRDEVDEVVVHARRSMVRASVAWQIEGHDVAVIETRREGGEARGIVEPAVQREDLAWRANLPAQCRQAQVAGLHGQLLR